MKKRHTEEQIFGILNEAQVGPPSVAWSITKSCPHSPLHTDGAIFRSFSISSIFIVDANFTGAFMPGYASISR